MRTRSISVGGIVLLTMLAGPAMGDIITVQPNPEDLNGPAGLSHNTYWTWGIDVSGLPADVEVTSAVLTVTGLYNWNIEPNWFQAYLLNDPVVGVAHYQDVNDDGDSFATWDGTPLYTFSDFDGPATTDTIEYVFSADEIDTLLQYASDGVVGFGFDPDCHFYLEDVSFTVDIPPVPEPTSLVLLGLGVAGAMLRRKFFA